MAPPSPRRSSRARTTTSQSQNSSASSGISARPERNTRSFNKLPSDKSTPSASLSSEPLEDTDDALLGRRRKRGLEDEQERAEPPDPAGMAIVSEDPPDEEEDEAVRCICGSDEYPGPPPPDAPEADYFLAHELTEDVTGFFVQCDICKVWQHGACVGIFSAESSPDEYFCELCRTDFHKIYTANTGLKYSKYLPLHRQSRATSRTTSTTKDGPRSPQTGDRVSKNSRSNANPHMGKRRSTMNSRDAAYDDEQLRRAIEASKEDIAHDLSESVIRRTKRGRSDSESNNSAVKRQRTISPPASPPQQQPEAPAQDGSDEDTKVPNEPDRPRSNRSTREKSEKEERERQRQDAANKRRDRAERRRGEESDLSEEVPLAASKICGPSEPELSNAPEPNTTAQVEPGTPPATQYNATTSSSHKRGVRSHHKKSKGKNQYTKDREGDNEESPARSMSRDIQKIDDGDAKKPSKPIYPSEAKHPSKPKSAGPAKMSMLDMRRRVAAIMEFISRTQVDLAAEGSVTQSSESSDGQNSPGKASTSQEAHENDSPDKQMETDADKEFKDLNCIEMMDVLTREIVKWQNQFT